MNSYRKLILVAITGLLWGSLAPAEESDKIAAIEERLSQLFAGQVPDRVSESPVTGLYEVTVGPQLFYVSADGRYLMQGTIIDLDTKQNITEPRKGEARLNAIDEVGEENMVVFTPEKVEHTVTVFTDIECGYCRKLHREIDQYLDEGIKIRYLMYPRAGVGSSAYEKAVSVWCSSDRNTWLTRAKQGEEVPHKECDNPVREQMLLGQLLGIQGTPALVTDSGQLIPGYVPAKRLASMLGEGDSS